MRRLTVPLALLALLAFAATAFAETKPTTFDLGFTTKKPHKGTGFTFDVAFANAGGKAAALQAFKLSLPAGTKFNGAGAAQCKASEADIDSKFSAACPANTFVGTGTATAVGPMGGAPIKTTVKIANENGGRFRFFFAIGGTDVADFAAAAKGSTLASEPLRGSLPGGVTVTSLKGSIKKKTSKGKSLITTPKKCPKSKKLKFVGTFAFADGTKKVTDTASCKS